MKTTKKQLRRIIKEVMSTSQFLDDETISQQFKKWAVEYMGTPAGTNSSSVLATFLVDQGYDKDENIVADMSDSLGFDLRDVSMEVERQRKEYDAGGVISDEEIYQRGFKESTMKITKRQLRKIIREYHPRADDDYDPLNPPDEFAPPTPEEDAEYDRGYDDGFNGYPQAEDGGLGYYAGYEEGENDAKDPDSEASREYAEEIRSR